MANGGLEAGNAKRGAVENGDDVRQESGGPHDPGTHAQDSFDELGGFCRFCRND
jgi:hypothetical protein